MKFMNAIFTAFFLLWSSLAFAEWQEIADIKSMTTEQLDAYFLAHNKQFLSTTSEKGIKIVAMDCDYSTLVMLRNVKNKVDFNVTFYDPIFEERGSVYLEVLDEDGFLIESILVSKVGYDFVGELYGKFDMKWNSFKKIKYYNLVLMR